MVEFGVFLICVAVIFFLVGFVKPTIFKLSRKKILLYSIAMSVVGLIVSLVFIELSPEAKLGLEQKTMQREQEQKKDAEREINQKIEKVTTKELPDEIKESYILKDGALYKKIGENRAVEIEKKRLEFAVQMMQDEKCDKLAEVGVVAETVKDNAWFFALCDDKKTYYKLEDSSDIKKETDVTLKYIGQCQDMVKESAKFKSSVDFATFSTGSSIDKISGLVLVHLPFEAKNGFGNMLPYVAKCTFPIKGKANISIENN
jgi:hypothetical protein